MVVPPLGTRINLTVPRLRCCFSETNVSESNTKPGVRTDNNFDIYGVSPCAMVAINLMQLSLSLLNYKLRFGKL